MDLCERIETYWDERSNKFNNIRIQELNSSNYIAWQTLIQEHLPSHTNLNIIDIGTGTGFFAILLARMGHTVIGIDSSAKMIEYAKNNAAYYGCNIKFYKMNAQAPTFNDATFDLVISRNLTWTLPDAKKAYEEWFRILRTNGILMNFDSDYGKTCFSKNNDRNNIHKALDQKLLLECNSIKNKLSISTHIRPEWDLSILQKIGFHHCMHDKDIRQQVHKDKALCYDDAKLFAIYAVK